IHFNKPAVDASEIRYEVRQGRVFRDTASVQDALKKSITGLAGLRAKENINLVRETGRKQTVEFVEEWLSRTFPDGKDYPVKVFFPDEKPPGKETFAPSLEDGPLVPLSKDGVEGRYQRPVGDCWNAAKDVLNSKGQVQSEDRLQSTLEARINE